MLSKREAGTSIDNHSLDPVLTSRVLETGASIIFKLPPLLM